MTLAGKLVGFALLLGAGLVYWAFALRVRQLLKARHSSTWTTIAGNKLGFDQVMRFAWRRGDRSLRDAELTKNVIGFRCAALVVWLGIVWWAGVLFGLY